MKNSLGILKKDPWLQPYEEVINRRHSLIANKEAELIQEEKAGLRGFASAHLFFGLHKTTKGYTFREWAPNASAIFLIGTFNNWQEQENYKLHPKENGVWEIHLPSTALKHLDLYKLKVYWQGGSGERIPAYATRVVQDAETYIFTAQVWEPPQPYTFQLKSFTPRTSPLLIYECHVGMATEEEKVGTYVEFRDRVLPRIAKLGYNAIQIMAIQEHPYYGSFGYHVSSFFAASSRFGTPDELKSLIDKAHQLGLAVIMDLVHSHAVKNEVEGLGLLDGSRYQYFHDNERREHPAWDSLCFNYAKNEVLHFLLSNCRYWLEEYRFDGFRFDGVTSMLYYNHGLEKAYTNYGDYYDGGQDEAALTYLGLANKLIHQINPHAITIAEEVSGMPGIASVVEEGGYGFDYRLAMNIPDYWIKLIKEKKDEDWHPSSIWWETTNRRVDEKTISYAESHDQALVGDKTLLFRLVDADMYWHMSKLMPSKYSIDRGLALHKMIRLVTLSTCNGGYLTFMGNEFGHPEWIDFPRQDNNWSYKHARRQWHLADDPTLKYHYLLDFDKAMLALVQSIPHFETTPISKLWDKDDDQVLAFQRDKFIFVFNFNPSQSFDNYGFLAPVGSYKVVLNTDAEQFGGFGLSDDSVVHHAPKDPLYAKDNKAWLKLYLPARTAMVLKRIR